MPGFAGDEQHPGGSDPRPRDQLLDHPALGVPPDEHVSQSAPGAPPDATASPALPTFPRVRNPLGGKANDCCN